MDIRVAAAWTAFAWCLAGPASTATASCVWDNLTPATRDALTRAEAEHGGEAFTHVTPTDADGEAVVAACGESAATEDSLLALRQYVSERAAATWLADNRGLSLSRLEAAWASLSQSEQAVVLAAAVGVVEDDAAPNSAFPVIDRLNATLGLVDKESRMQGFAWAFRRALRLVYEHRASAAPAPRPQA